MISVVVTSQKIASKFLSGVISAPVINFVADRIIKMAYHLSRKAAIREATLSCPFSRKETWPKRTDTIALQVSS